MTDDVLSLMKIHDYFRGLSDDILTEVAKHIEITYYETGDCAHEANEPVTFVGFLVRGRMKAVIVDEDGKEKLLQFAVRGDQLGMISAALSEPVPIRLVAVEPSTLLRLDYNIGLELTAKYPELRKKWSQKLAGSLRQSMLGDKKTRKTSVIAIFHETSRTRPFVPQLMDRLCKLGEKPCLFSDDESSIPKKDIPFRGLIENDEYLSPNQVRDQVAKWSQCNRIIIDVVADMELDVAARLASASDYILWCSSEEERDSSVEHLRRLESKSEFFRDKLNLVWFLTDKHISPVTPERRTLVAREFILSDQTAQSPLGISVSNGLERLVHYLRGIKIGLALGGGAALGMAHLGVLKMLDESGIAVDMIAGTSAGAMAGILYGSGLDADFLAEQFVKNLEPGWLFRRLPRGKYWYLIYNYRRGRFDPMLRKYIEDWRLEQLPIPCSAITVDLVSGDALVRDQGDAVHAILESINLPVLAAPIRRPGQALIDGGFLNNVPADVLVSKGCNFVIAVDVLSKIKKKVGKVYPDTPVSEARPPSIFETVLRTYTVLSHNITAIGAGPADVTIEPNVSSYDMADFTLAKETAAIGKEKTRERLPTIRALLNRMDPELFPK